MPLKKAEIHAEMPNNQEDSVIEVLFNPNQYSIEASNRYAWKKIPGRTSPIGQFISGETASLSMELFFDTYGEYPVIKDLNREVKEKRLVDVREYTSQIVELLDINEELASPPLCKFIWGSLYFEGYLERVSQKFTMFDDSGIPVRARLNVVFKSAKDMNSQFKRVSQKSSKRTKIRTVKQGETISMIAEEEYKNIEMWRKIAQANKIDNPRVLKPGTQLTIPPI